MRSLHCTKRATVFSTKSSGGAWHTSTVASFSVLPGKYLSNKLTALGLFAGTASATFGATGARTSDGESPLFRFFFIGNDGLVGGGGVLMYPFEKRCFFMSATRFKYSSASLIYL
ncbi:hypothetical protein AGDE_14900 [Angomonas deanei]|nr:hypothetical protein AGDE_14900 [Angomonas deanei]|eukprot:EPY20025.1 hypothetical protein AGDE_14900 [Angomonas deanei]